MTPFRPRRRQAPQPSRAPASGGLRPWGSRPRPWLARFAERRRRSLAAALLCAAAAAAVYQLTPPSSASSPAVVADVDLPAGATVQSGQLRVARLAAETVPDGAVKTIETAVGHKLTGPMRRGEVVTDAALVGPGLLTGTPAGTVAVPVRVADPGSLQLVRTGQDVDIVVSEEASRDGPRSTTVAQAVTVLWTGQASGTANGWLGTAKDTEGLLVVAARPAEAQQLAGASTRGKVFFVLVDGKPR
ncbi:Flp pilus assembly protein CpaB [Sinomonas sp. P47F7]|uniref:Flp pilus assembly protein CpaB n=1 Tax=Sinomonas sp. P47F7 TaxID=3410987 RepID=UPI003BF5B0EB